MQTTNNYKVHVEFEGSHNGWLDDMLDLIRRIYDMDYPYCHSQVDFSIHFDSYSDTGSLSATIHYPSHSELNKELDDSKVINYE